MILCLRAAQEKRKEIEMKSYPCTKDAVTVPPGTPSGTLFVDVGDTLGALIDPRTNAPTSPEDCARGFWDNANLSAARADQCDWLAARKNRRIIGIWEIDRSFGWHPLMSANAIPGRSDESVDPQRSWCKLLPTDDALNARLVGKEVHLGRCHNSLRSVFD